MSWTLNAEKARLYLGDSETPATVLHLIILKTYGAEYVYGSDDQDAADPIELWNAVEEDFRISIPVEVENKLNAIMVACSTEAFFTNIEAFSSICTALATGDLGDAVNGSFERPSVYQMLCGILEVDLNDGDREAVFSREVMDYIRDILDSENVDTEGELDAYTEDTDTYMETVRLMILDLGAPSHLVQLPDKGELYGLLPKQ